MRIRFSLRPVAPERADSDVERRNEEDSWTHRLARLIRNTANRSLYIISRTWIIRRSPKYYRCRFRRLVSVFGAQGAFEKKTSCDNVVYNGTISKVAFGKKSAGLAEIFGYKMRFLRGIPQYSLVGRSRLSLENFQQASSLLLR